MMSSSFDGIRELLKPIFNFMLPILCRGVGGAVEVVTSMLIPSNLESVKESQLTSFYAENHISNRFYRFKKKKKKHIYLAYVSDFP